MPGAICGLEAFGLGPQLLAGFAVDPDLVERAQRLTPHDARADLVALAACCLDASAPALAERLDAFEFPARERDTVVAAATRARALAPVLGGLERPSAIWALLRREAPETVALAGALGAPEPARRWLDELRHVRLAISGDDLVAAGLRARPSAPGSTPPPRALLDGEATGARRSWRRRWRRPRRRRARLRASATMAADGPPCALPLARRAHRRRPARRPGALLDPPRRRLGGAVRLAQPRPADRRPGANVDANRERLAAAVGRPRERFLSAPGPRATVRRATEPPGPGRPPPPRTARRPRSRARRRSSSSPTACR